MRAFIQRVDLPLRTPLRTARGTLESRRVLLLRVESGGRVGWGEAAPLPGAGTEGRRACAAALGTAADLLRDGVLPLDPPGAWEALLLGALGGAPAARHAVDVALWDLAAQRAGVPLAHLLAADPADTVRANALLSGRDLGASAARAVGGGFEVLKLKVAARPLEEDCARLAAVRESAPGAVLRLDANGGWLNARRAVAAVHRLGEEGVDAIEQPVPPHDPVGLAWLKSRLTPAVAADESVLDEASGLALLEQGGVDALVLKPMKLGGLGPCIRLAREAKAVGVRLWITTTIDGAVGRMAALHLAAAIDPEGREAHGLATGRMLASDVVRATHSEGPRLAVPTTPGLGVVPDAVPEP